MTHITHTTFTPNQTTTPRRCGISIMEVLISIAIVAIGLLGVLAMLPIGHMFVQTAIRADHSIALAEKGFNDIMVRGWLKNLDFDTDDDGENDIFAIAVDPLSNSTANLGGSNLIRDDAGISQAMAREIFVGTDDVSYDPPANVGDLPQVIYTKGPDPNDADAEIDLKRGYYPSYKFLATVVPQGTGSKVAKVSVAVFYKRNESAELKVFASHLAGSDIELTFNLGDATEEAVKKLKKNQWLLLEDTTTNFYGWYRIISAADGSDFASNKAWVTLDGPNIPSTITGAILFDQVLAVYERTVTIE